jgi:hypothetical protein
MFGWRIHMGHENSYQIAIKSLFWPKFWIASYNTQEANFCSTILQNFECLASKVEKRPKLLKNFSILEIFSKVEVQRSSFSLLERYN